MKVNDKVKYKDINLVGRGRITHIGRERNGGDCRVKWDGYELESVECLVNLEII